MPLNWHGFNNGAMYADNGESWKMSMLLHGSFISLDNELEGIYRLFYWDFNSFFFLALEYPYNNMLYTIQISGIYD